MQDHIYPEEYRLYHMERLMAKRGGNPSIHDAVKKIKKRKKAINDQLKRKPARKKK